MQHGPSVIRAAQVENLLGGGLLPVVDRSPYCGPCSMLRRRESR